MSQCELLTWTFDLFPFRPVLKFPADFADEVSSEVLVHGAISHTTGVCRFRRAHCYVKNPGRVWGECEGCGLCTGGCAILSLGVTLQIGF
jgi:hypothetical protein